MKRLLCFAAFLMACSGAEKKGETEIVDELHVIDCGSEQAQKLITYCASPQAAELAKKNLELGAVKEPDIIFSALPPGSSPSFGAEDALVTIVMFSDLQCPFCKLVHEQLERIADTKNVKVVFKHAPLPFHENAVPAALAAINAHRSGKFWEYVKLAYANQGALSGPELKQYAEQLGLDGAAFEQSFGTPEDIEVIQNDINLGRTAGVEATPTIFVNGIRIVGLSADEELIRIVDQELAYAQKMVDAGVPKEDVYWRALAVNYEPVEITNEAPEPEPPAVAMVPVIDAPVKGAPADNALVTIVEFSDFECSYCRKAQTWLNDYVAANEDHVRLVYRHLPLPFHENADIAAAASIVAHQEGKFWEFHDILFANQDKLSADDLVQHAKTAKINRTKFKKLRQSDGVIEILKSDIEMAQALGIGGTPTFFVNGIQYIGVPQDDTFPELVELQRQLAQKISEETGLKGDALYEAVVKANQEAN